MIRPSPHLFRHIVILGPTAAGKTSLAVHLGRQMAAEIISADSRQVYRSMDIGTAKPSPAEQSLVRHHLLDIVNPDELLGLAEYLRLARRAIDDVRLRGLTPMLVGGSAQYIWALVEGWQVPEVAPDYELRSRLSDRARDEGSAALHQELMSLDPDTALDIHPNNVRRVIRALELHSQTGLRPSSLRRRRGAALPCIILGVGHERQELYRRIDERVEAMFEAGLVAEVEGLLAAGYDPGLPAMSGIGYTQVVQLLRGNLTRSEAIAQAKLATHRLARQQSVWFRRDDPRICWLNGPDLEGALQRIQAEQTEPAHAQG